LSSEARLREKNILHRLLQVRAETLIEKALSQPSPGREAR